MNPSEERELEELQSADAWDWETSQAGLGLLFAIGQQGDRSNGFFVVRG